MLGQLVCIDRRYQRMNCFNIREVQSLLKRKFFHDLVISADHHTLLNSTIMNLRYKTNNLSVLDSNTFLLNTAGVTYVPGNRFLDFTGLGTSEKGALDNRSYSGAYFFSILDLNFFAGLTTSLKSFVSSLLFYTNEAILPTSTSLMSTFYAYYVAILYNTYNIAMLQLSYVYFNYFNTSVYKR